MTSYCLQSFHSFLTGQVLLFFNLFGTEQFHLLSQLFQSLRCFDTRHQIECVYLCRSEGNCFHILLVVNTIACKDNKNIRTKQGIGRKTVISDFLSHLLTLIPLNVAGVLFGLAVIVNTYEQEVIRVFGHLGWVLLALNLIDSSIGVLPELQFEDNGR